MNGIISVDNGLIKKIGQFIPQDLKNHRMVIVTDHRVKNLYAQPLVKALIKSGYEPELIAFPFGEKSKSRESKEKIESFLLKKRCGRDTCLLALGGGVIGDLTGFTAATYMRGIPYIQIPTTLLAMVDSSIGGKTGINIPEGKNLIGAFWEPRAVIADLDTLNSLPAKQLINGWVEALKIFIIRDAKAFKEAIQAGQPTLDLVRDAMTRKVEIVDQDPLDKGLRNILNFGHTIGHALEKTTEYKMPHGFAVGYGMMVEAQISRQRGLLNSDEFAQVMHGIEDLKLYAKNLDKYEPSLIVQNCAHDKKSEQGQIRSVLLSKIGQVYTHEGQYTHEVSANEIIHALKDVRSNWNAR